MGKASLIKVSEIFTSIQGEGSFAGTPAIFVRLSGCTRKCSFCDSKYHDDDYLECDIIYVAESIIREMMASKIITVIWTGGEPLLYKKKIKEIISIIAHKLHIGAFTDCQREIINEDNIIYHLETNGDLLTKKDFDSFLEEFDYVCISPKDLKTAKKVHNLIDNAASSSVKLSIKVVTDDIDLNMGMVHYATTLMPLTTGNVRKDKATARRVWKLCIHLNKIYSPRLHIDLFKNKRKV